MSQALLGVIIGGAIAFSTAALGHIFAWLQLRSKRAFDLRQSVYLDAATAIANSLRFFDAVADLSTEDARLSDHVHPVSAAMFKIHVVGTPATIAALSGANHCLTTAALDLTTRRGQLKSAVANNAEADDAVAASEIDRLRRDLVYEAMRASMLYQRHLGEMNIAVRKELGFPLDKADYLAGNRQAEQKIVATIDEAIQRKSEPA